MNKSLPSRGAWIEIGTVQLLERPDPRRSPHGERGLKCGHDVEILLVGDVAPLTGSVD